MIMIMLDVNKFKCMNQLYLYEMHCPQSFIKVRKTRFTDNIRDKQLWTKDQLDLINHKRNGVGYDSVPSDSKLFEDANMNSLLFKHF